MVPYFQMKTTHSGSQDIKKNINKVKYDKIDFPVKIKDIPKIEPKIKPFTLFIILKKFVIKLVIYF